MYTTTLAQKILIRLHERQWHAYRSDDILSLGRDLVICRGPAQRLRVRESYVLFPRIVNSRDPQEVMQTFDRLTTPPKGLPTIVLYNQTHTIAGFACHTDSVRTYTFPALVLTYEDFLSGLETLVRGVA